MKAVFVYVGGAIGVIALMFMISFAMRFLSNRATPISVQQVKPGVSCATAVTSDGVAISCWKD